MMAVGLAIMLLGLCLSQTPQQQPQVTRVTSKVTIQGRAMPMAPPPVSARAQPLPTSGPSDRRIYAMDSKATPRGSMGPGVNNMRVVRTTVTRPPVATEVLSPPEISSAAQGLLDSIKEAQDEDEYKDKLGLYEEFKKAHKDSGVCLPQAPELIPSSFPKKPTPAQRDCRKGYKIGWRHGKKWAQIIVRDNEKKEVGEDHLKCLLNYLEPGNIDPKLVCAYKAARASYDKWYKRLTDPKARTEYQAFKGEEPSSIVEIEQPKRRRMTPSEAEFVQSLGLTPDMA
jgi:hypothetical protein